MVALLTGLVAFGAYLVFLPQVPYWLDAPEFIAAGANLGLPHPPGHPAMILLLKGFLLLPFGDIAFRANLFSATFAAVSAALVSKLAKETAACGSTRRSSWFQAAGVAAGLGFALSGSAVMQAMSVEVYTFSCALVLGALYLAIIGQSDARHGVVAAILMAVGLANHHLLVFLAVPAVMVAWIGRGTRLAALGIVVLVGVVVTAACYVYLPVRSAAGAQPSWADTSSLDGVLWYASARIFAGSVGGFSQAGSSVGLNVVKAIGLLAGALSPPLLVLAAAGAYLRIRSGGFRLVLVLLVFVLGNLVSKVGMGLLDPSNPDDHGYFLPAIAGVAILASMAGASLPLLAAPLGRVARGFAAVCGAAILMLVAVSPALVSGGAMAVERSTLREPVDVANSLWDGAPPRTVLMPSHYPVHFLLMYGQVVEGRRPDVSLVQQSLYSKARGGLYYAEAVARRDPDLAPFIRTFLWSGTLDWEALRTLAASRPVRLFASDDFDAPLADLRFDGWTFDVAARSARPVESRPDVAQHLQQLRRVAWHWPEVDIETRRVLMRHLATSGVWLAGQGNREEAVGLLDAAIELNPMDGMLKRMRSTVQAVAP